MSQDKNQSTSNDAQEHIDFRLSFKSLEQKFEWFELSFDEVNEREQIKLNLIHKRAVT